MENEEKVAHQFYWCVSCGSHGDFGKLRKTRLFCRECGYEDISLYTQEDIDESEDLKFRRFLRKTQ